MKTRTIVVAVFSIAAFAVGCKPTDNQSVTEQQTDKQFEQAKRETKEAAQAVKDYTYAQKAEYVEKMKAEIAELNKEMDQLAVKVENSNAANKDEAKAKLQSLREKTAELDKKLDNAKDATESTWDEVKAGFKKGYDEVKDSVNQSRQWLSEKIAP